MRSGPPSSPVPEQGPVGAAGGDRGDENYKDRASGDGLLHRQRGRAASSSEDGAEGLVRLVGRRRLARCAGSIGASNVACRGLTPDLATAIQAVAKSGVEAGRIGAVARMTDLPFGEAAPQAAEGPRRHPGSPTHAALRARSPASSLLRRPALDLRAKPEFDPAVAEIDDGTRHVVIPALVETDAVPVRKPERIRDSLRVHQVFRGYEWRHSNKATAVDGSVRRDR